MFIYQLFNPLRVACVIDDLTGILSGDPAQVYEKVQVLLVSLDIFLAETAVFVEAGRTQGDF